LSYKQEVLNDTPDVYLRLGESSGTVATDVSGNARNGTYNGTGVTYSTTGALTTDADTAVTLDGTAGKIDLPVGYNPSGAGITVEAWYYIALSTDVSTSPRLVANAKTNTTFTGFQLRLDSASGCAFQIGSGSTSSTVLATAGAVTAATWHHLVGTYDSSTLRLYQDGVLLNTAAYTGSVTASATQVSIGRLITPSGNFFKGGIDEVAIYPSVLTLARIKEHYRTGAIARVVPATMYLGVSGTTSTRTVTPATLALLATSTRSVPSTIATFATSKRTVPATIATLATSTRTVPPTLALLKTANRVVPATLSLGTSANSRTVPATLAMIATSNRIVPSTVATLATSTRIVPSSLSATFTNSRSVPATLATLATNSRSVLSTIATLATSNRVVPASLSLGTSVVTSTRTVPATLAMVATSNRVIPATMATLATSTRSVPSSLSATLTNSRSVPATLALLATASRIVPTTLATMATSTRTIPATLWLSSVAVSTRTVPTTLAITAYNARIVPSTIATIATTKRQVPATLYLSGSTVSAYKAAVLTDTPLAYYRLAETSGTVATDVSGNGYNATYTSTGVTYGVTGAMVNESNTGITLNGTTGHVDLPAGVSLNGLAACSVETWVKIPAALVAVYPRIVANSYTDTSHQGIQLFLQDVGGIFSVGNGTITVFTTLAGPLPPNIWHHLVGTYDGIYVRLYIDGTLINQQALTGTIGTAAYNLSIGYNPAYSGDYYAGSVDETAIYGYALSLTQIQNHYIAATTSTATLSGGYTVSIAGVALPIQAGTLSINKALGQRSTCSFTVWDTTGLNHFVEGSQVTITNQNGVTDFYGFVQSSTEVRPGYGSLLLHTIQCMDSVYLADKRLIAKTYTAMQAGKIVQDILTNVLSLEGVTAGTISAGPTVPLLTVNYATASQVIMLLAERSGYWWDIDEKKQLQFQPATGTIAPFTVNSNKDLEATTVSAVRSSDLYRNRQYMRGINAPTSSQTETRKGDGTTKAFLMSYPLSQVPTITLNTVAQTVGISGVDTGKNYYWSANSNVIAQDTGGTTLITTDTLSVTYIGSYAAIVESDDYSAQATRAVLEGSTGIVEAIEDVPNSRSLDDAIQDANGKLMRFTVNGVTLSFDTLKTGLKPGQLLTVTAPEHNLTNAQLLIESVQVYDRDPVLGYHVKAMLGPVNTSWVQYFANLANKPAVLNNLNVGNSGTIAIPVSVSDSTTWGETSTVTVYACPICGTSTFCGTAVFVC